MTNQTGNALEEPQNRLRLAAPGYAEIEAERNEIWDSLDNATFEDKRRYFDLLNVRGKLAVENEEKVVCVSCQFKQQRLSVAPTLPWSSKRNGTEITLTARLVIETAHLV